MAHDLLTLTREQLYALVWSKPVSELAKDFGISDVGLAKRLRKLNVPVPGRGYWARVSAGQAPVQLPLPDRPPSPLDRSSLTFGPATEPEVQSGPETEATDALRNRIAEIDLLAKADLTTSHPAILRTALSLKRPWRRDIPWKRGQKDGAIVNIDVSESAEDRALSLADRILRGAEQLGWHFNIPPSPPSATAHPQRTSIPIEPLPTRMPGQLDVMGEWLTLTIEERRHRIPHVLTEAEQKAQRLSQYSFAPAWDYEPRGELIVRVTCADCTYLSKTFNDAKRLKLDDKLSDLLLACGELTRCRKQQREDARLRQIAQREEEERQLIARERRDAHTELAHELERQAGAWHYAQYLRRYLRAAKRVLGTKRLQAEFLKEPIDFIEWAEAYIQQLDPLTPSPHNSELTEGRSYYTPTDEKLEAMMLRITGAEWRSASKLLL